MLMMMKQNDTYPVLSYQITKDDGSPVDLTGATVNFVMGKKNKLVINSAANITAAVDGMVEYKFGEVDTLSDGEFLGEFAVTFPNGRNQTFPSNEYIAIHINQNLDTSQKTVIIDAIAERQGEFTAKLESILKQAGNITMSGMNECTWIAEEGQVKFIMPSNANYDPSGKWFQVYLGGIPVDQDLINRQIKNQFTINIDPSIVKAGMKIIARWTEPIVPVTVGHHTVHELGGQDELDITKLKNYQTNVADVLNSVNTQLADIVIQVVGGGIDDTSTIQSIINNAKSGSTINFNNVCVIDVGKNPATVTDNTDPSYAGLIVDKPLKFTCGVNGELKAKNGSGILNANNYMFSVTSEKVDFVGVSIDGDRLNVNSSYGIQINKSNCKVEKCTIRHLDGSPVLVNGLNSSNFIENIEINNNKIDDVGNTFFATFTKNINILDNYVHNASEGIDFDKSVINAKIDNNTFDTYRGTGTDAAVEVNGGKDIVISNNKIYNFVDGVLINGKTIESVDIRSENIIIKDNTIKTVNGYGVVIGNVFAAGDDLITGEISGNIIDGATLDGINLRGKDIEVFNNTIKNCSYGGVLADTGGTDISISKNIITGCNRYGVSLTNVTTAKISDNIIKDNNKSGTYNGIYFTGGCTQVELSNNHVSGSHDYGVRAAGTNDMMVNNNDLSGTLGGLRNSSTTTVIHSGQNKGTIDGGVSMSGNRIFYGSAAPTSSSFTSKIGDICYNTNPIAGGNIGWVCTVAGTPGTWKTFGVISA